MTPMLTIPIKCAERIYFNNPQHMYTNWIQMFKLTKEQLNCMSAESAAQYEIEWESMRPKSSFEHLEALRSWSAFGGWM